MTSISDSPDYFFEFPCHFQSVDDDRFRFLKQEDFFPAALRFSILLNIFILMFFFKKNNFFFHIHRTKKYWKTDKNSTVISAQYMG